MNNITSKSDQDLYNDLSCYTLSHPDPSFIHQHAVDAFAAQNATDNTKPIKIAFSLTGLYLYLEKNYTGKQVQETHMLMADRKKDWPTFDIPEDRGKVTVADVMAAPPGRKRDAMIRTWCEAVWNAYAKSHAKISKFVNGFVLGS